MTSRVRQAADVRSAIGGLVRELADLVLPRPCPGCGGPAPWCDGCAATLGGRPREPMLSDVLEDFPLPALPAFRSLARYRGPVRAAIIAGKERGRRDLPPLLGAAIGAGLLRLQAISLIPPRLWLIPAPTKRSAARSRGGDPVLTMARAAAMWLSQHGRVAGVAACLHTAAGASDSVRLTASERAANLAGRVRVRAAALPPPRAAVVLIDDVLTTGATALASCAALADVGVSVDCVLTLAAVPPWRPVR